MCSYQAALDNFSMKKCRGKPGRFYLLSSVNVYLGGQRVDSLNKYVGPFPVVLSKS